MGKRESAGAFFVGGDELLFQTHFQGQLSLGEICLLSKLRDSLAEGEEELAGCRHLHGVIIDEGEKQD